MIVATHKNTIIIYLIDTVKLYLFRRQELYPSADQREQLANATFLNIVKLRRPIEGHTSKFLIHYCKKNIILDR